MRKPFFLWILLAASACQQNVVVPNTDELMSDPKLLAKWQAKCDAGEYSHLPADQKNNLCFTTQEATRSLAIKKIYGV